eukprot:TRINITY_DN4361_c0_g1_i5.p1 TRINITY_DN4361_c0_g1~~TRINITY_DN4361_c0_g1_i5.p1  ORF type:complete len:229 (+),score=47.55 TRINITY_DN4361_c0_g1_i5:78-689(+)
MCIRDSPYELDNTVYYLVTAKNRQSPPTREKWAGSFLDNSRTIGSSADKHNKTLDVDKSMVEQPKRPDTAGKVVNMFKIRNRSAGGGARLPRIVRESGSLIYKTNNKIGEELYTMYIFKTNDREFMITARRVKDGETLKLLMHGEYYDKCMQECKNDLGNLISRVTIAGGKLEIIAAETKDQLDTQPMPAPETAKPEDVKTHD